MAVTAAMEGTHDSFGLVQLCNRSLAQYGRHGDVDALVDFKAIT